MAFENFEQNSLFIKTLNGSIITKEDDNTNKLDWPTSKTLPQHPY